MVYVISKSGKPLMPCENVIARLLLKNKKAKVIRREPFTIKLNYETTEYTQPVTLGVDTGSGKIGVAATTPNGKVLYCSEVKVRNDITKKMKRRAKYRRNRRNRKTRYRAKRFDHRKNSIKKDRISPTMRSKIQSHIKEIEFVKKILPVKRIVLETGTFDAHLMKNPILANSKVRHWGYQKGANYGFASVREKVLNRDNYTCQICKGKNKSDCLHVHHIIFRSNGGSDTEDNLITLCSKCHQDIHAEKIKIDLNGKIKGTLKYATQMNSIRKQLLKKYPEAIETFGYITKTNRFLLGIPKSHINDACVIATGGKSFKASEKYYKKVCVSKGDYQQTKGVRSEQKLTTGKVDGFRKFDKVKYFGKSYFIKGRMIKTKTVILMGIDEKKIDFSNLGKGLKTPKMQNLKRVSARKAWMVNLERN